MAETTNEYAQFEYDTENKWVRFVWKKYARSADYRDVVQQGLVLAASKKSAKMLNDCTNMGVVGQGDQKWLLDYLKEHSKKDGLRFVAVVVPQEALALMSAQSLKKDLQVDPDLPETQYFGSQKDAVAWLKTV
jgi:hypothetical protein